MLTGAFRCWHHLTPTDGEAHKKLTTHWQLLTLQSIYKKERNVTRNKNDFSFFFSFFF